MDVLLLSAGIGSRLMPLTFFHPKCLLPIPKYGHMLNYWVDYLLTYQNMDRIFINTFWLRDQIIDYANQLERPDIFVYEESYLEPVGEVLYNLSRKGVTDLLVVFSDTFIPYRNIAKFIFNSRVNTTHPVCVGITWSDDLCGRSCLEVERMVISSFVEKPEGGSGYCFSGICLLNLPIIKFVFGERLKSMELTADILPELARFITWVPVDFFHDIGRSVLEYQKIPSILEEFKCQG